MTRRRRVIPSFHSGQALNEVKDLSSKLERPATLQTALSSQTEILRCAQDDTY